MARKSIKRENGTGSVYKRKDLKRRPWVAVAPAELIRDDDARKVNAKQMIIGHYATAQEAKDALDEYRRNPTTKYNITLAELALYPNRRKTITMPAGLNWSHYTPTNFERYGQRKCKLL